MSRPYYNHGLKHANGEDPIPGLGGSSYAYTAPTNLTPASGRSPASLSIPNLGFHTNDASIFEWNTLSSVGGIHVMQAGTYCVMVTGWFDSGSASSGQFAQINLVNPGIGNVSPLGPFMDFGGGDWEAAITYVTLWQGGGASVVSGNMIQIQACENSTGGATLDVGLEIFFVSSDTT